MLRIVRIFAIIVFALLLGFSANALGKMYQSGTLLERYNSERKSSVTLATLSVLALVSLGAFEMRKMGKVSEKHRYGERRYTKDQGPAENVNPSSIYASRTTVDEWKGKRISSSRSSRRRSEPVRYLPEVWMAILRFFCLILPLAYTALFAMLYMRGFGKSIGPWAFSGICSAFLTLNIVVAIGVFLKKTWGLSLGYLLAILNLVIFPVGTALGLILLILLVGASSLFSAPSRSRGQMRSFV